MSSYPPHRFQAEVQQYLGRRPLAGPRTSQNVSQHGEGDAQATRVQEEKQRQTRCRLDDVIQADVKRAIEIARAESEASRDQPIPEGVRGGRRGRSVGQSVRLPAEEFAEIERIAAGAGVPVGALIREWVLAGLAAEQAPSLRSAIDHLAAGAERLRRLAAASNVA